MVIGLLQETSGIPDSSDEPEPMAVKVQPLTSNGKTKDTNVKMARRELEAIAILRKHPHPDVVSETGKAAGWLLLTST